jgi:hypothetical protein
VATAVTALATGLEGQANQAGDAEVKSALAEFATSARGMVTAIAAAGNDMDKVMGALDLDAMRRFDAKIVSLCK